MRLSVFASVLMVGCLLTAAQSAEPDAFPALMEIVSEPPPHFGNQGSFACYGLTLPQCAIVTKRNDAMRRIFEIDPAEGRAVILRDLSDPQAQPPLSLVKLLPSNDLRPFVQQAVQRIESSDAASMRWARLWDYSLVDLFGEKSDLEPLEAKFTVDKDHVPKGFCVPYTAQMVRYLVRVDPELGAKELKAQLATRDTMACHPALLEDLGTLLPKVEQVAVNALDDPDPQISAGAARALGRWGMAQAEPALWARLGRFHVEWPMGVGELPLSDKFTPAQARALDNLESTLVRSIVSGTNWICGPDKLSRLRTLTSRKHWIDLSQWTEEWEEGQPWILLPNWDSDDASSFSVLQYLNLDKEQIRTKLAQFPRNSKLYFQTFTAEQMGAPVSMEKQQAVLQELRKYAAKFGVVIEERPRSEPGIKT